MFKTKFDPFFITCRADDPCYKNSKNVNYSGGGDCINFRGGGRGWLEKSENTPKAESSFAIHTRKWAILDYHPTTRLSLLDIHLQFFCIKKRYSLISENMD